MKVKSKSCPKASKGTNDGTKVAKFFAARNLNPQEKKSLQDACEEVIYYGAKVFPTSKKYGMTNNKLLTHVTHIRNGTTMRVPAGTSTKKRKSQKRPKRTISKESDPVKSLADHQAACDEVINGANCYNTSLKYDVINSTLARLVKSTKMGKPVKMGRPKKKPVMVDVDSTSTSTDTATDTDTDTATATTTTATATSAPAATTATADNVQDTNSKVVPKQKGASQKTYTEHPHFSVHISFQAVQVGTDTSR